MVSCSYLSDRQADPISDYHIQMVMVHIVTVMITTNLAIYFIISDSQVAVLYVVLTIAAIPSPPAASRRPIPPLRSTPLSDLVSLFPSLQFSLSVSTVLFYRFSSSFLPFQHFFFTVSAVLFYRFSISILPLKQIPLSIFVVPSYHFDSSLLQPQ